MDQRSIELREVSPLKRASLWLMCLAVIFIVALKPENPISGYDNLIDWKYFHVFGWPLMALSLFLGWKTKEGVWFKTLVLFAYTIIVLFITNVNSDPSDPHLIELGITLGIGILLVPALLAKYWLKTPLDYHWWNGKWTLKMWLWLPGGALLAFIVLGTYANFWTPTLHTSWPLVGKESEALSRIFWGVNLGGLWDELAWINFVFCLLLRHFSVWEANFAQAIFFTSFLFDIAFFGAGPIVIFVFALIQGYTYKKTGSLLFIVVLHLMIDSVLFTIIANRYYPGWGWGG